MLSALLLATALPLAASPAEAMRDIGRADSAQVYLIKARDRTATSPKIKMKPAWLRSFKKIMGAKKSFTWPKDGRRKRCRFSPHLAVKLSGSSREIQFCFNCNDVQLDESGALVDFKPSRRRLAKLFSKAFPKHKPLRAIARGQREVEWSD